MLFHNTSFFLLCYLLSVYSLSLELICEGVFHNEWWPGDYGPTCLPDKSGWFDYECHEEEDRTKDYWHTYWGKIINHKCPTGYTCICKEGTECSRDELCFKAPSSKPKFVKTGMLQLTGSSGGSDEYGDEVVPVKGMIIKDKTGRYFKESTVWDGKWMQKYEIIVPMNETFMKYNGNFAGGSCSMTKSVNTNSLFSVDLNEWHQQIKRGAKLGMERQIWRKKFPYHDGTYTTKEWKLNVNTTTNIAYPVKYHGFFQYDGAYRNDIDQYTYRSALNANDEKWFAFISYCRPTQSSITAEKILNPPICAFPFTHKNETFTKCTQFEHTKLWCALDGNYDGRWINC